MMILHSDVCWSKLLILNLPYIAMHNNHWLQVKDKQFPSHPSKVWKGFIKKTCTPIPPTLPSVGVCFNAKCYKELRRCKLPL